MKRGMSVGGMRWLDYWVGVPLCFLLELVRYAAALLRVSRRKRVPVRTVLFIKLSEMGAIILAYPLLAKLKSQLPEAKFYFLTFKKNAEVFQLPQVFSGLLATDSVITIRDEGLLAFCLDSLAALRKIRRLGLDATFDLEFFSRYSAILTFLSAAPRRAGFYRYSFEGLWRGNFLTHRIAYNPLLHMRKMYLSLAQVILDDEHKSPALKEKINDQDLLLPRLRPQEKTRESLIKGLQQQGIMRHDKLVLVNPGDGILPFREWPLDNFIQLCRRLLEDDGARRIVIIGKPGIGGKELLLQQALEPRRVLNLVGRTTLPELMELFGIAELLVVNDCGLAHLASLVPLKKFVIFGPESPQVFAPAGEDTYVACLGLACSPCLSVLNHRQSPCRSYPCVRGITVDHIYRLIKEHL